MIWLFLLLGKIVHHPLGGLATRDHHRWHARTWTRAGANEVQVVESVMAIVRAEICQLGEVVAESMRGTFQQVIALAP